MNDANWVRNPIDHFILARLEEEGIDPSPEADRRTLIRRLSLDLIGLPPLPETVAAFVADPREDAYVRWVDTLLASPAFGERWGRHWLDLARYADSDGYEKDTVRPYAYLYRDWVIDAINRDLPFDQFSIEQLAGDLLPNATLDQKTATGFHRNTLTNKEGGVDQEEYRTKATVDRTSTTGTVWLGLTVGCAECHDHKYDPISQRDFFRLYAFFNNASEYDLPVPTSAELAEYEKEQAAWEQQRAALKSRLDRHVAEALPARFREWQMQAVDSKERTGLPDNIAAILAVTEQERTDEQISTLAQYYRTEIDDLARDLTTQLAEHEKKKPKFPPRKAQTMTADSRQTQIHIRGDFLRKGDVVQPGTPAILPPLPQQPHAAGDGTDIPDRLDLARWLFDPANPLTARVAVNQIWAHLFGRGLVATSDDFGTRGEPPSHPELLDWLATEYPRLGWSRKALVKLIVTSAVYRQASHGRPDLAQRDPNNHLLARQNRFRVDAETVRDAFLRTAGLLSDTIGGPSVRPPLPADIAALGYASAIRWKEEEGAGRYRRGLYILLQRTVPYPMLTMFDAPDSAVTCTRRERSNTPLQALTLLNDPVFFECAQGLGQRLAALPGPDPAAKLRRAFEICLSRPPTPLELARAEQLYRDQLRLVRAAPENARAIAGEPSDDSDRAETAAWVLVARSLMNLDEFFTRE